MCKFLEKKAEMVICTWYDNRGVINTSNFFGKDPIFQPNLFHGRNDKMIHVPHPASVDRYNCFMGGVDKADMLLLLYRSKMRSRKWYHRIVVHLVFLALINSFTVYLQMGGTGVTRN